MSYPAVKFLNVVLKSTNGYNLITYQSGTSFKLIGCINFEAIPSYWRICLVFSLYSLASTILLYFNLFPLLRIYSTKPAPQYISN